MVEVRVMRPNGGSVAVLCLRRLLPGRCKHAAVSDYWIYVQYRLAELIFST